MTDDPRSPTERCRIPVHLWAQVAGAALREAVESGVGPASPGEVIKWVDALEQCAIRGSAVTTEKDHNRNEVDVFISSGILSDSWVRLEGHCDIEYQVVGDEAQLRFGSRKSSGLDMILSEEGLEKLVQKSTEALNTMRAEYAESDS